MIRACTVALVVSLLISGGSPALASGNGELKLPPFKKVTLKNGMTVLLMEQHEVPLVSFSFVVRAGSVADPRGKGGLASVTAGLLRQGTKTRTADQLSEQLDFIGGELSASATYDLTSGSAEFMKKDVERGLELLADVLLNPIFPQDEVDKLLKQRIDGIRLARDRAQGVIGSYFNSYLFGDHPYGRPPGGDEVSLGSIGRDDVTGFYSAHYSPANTILAVVGDFTSAEMERLVESRFGGWVSRPARSVSPSEPAKVTGRKVLLVDKPDSTQTFFQIGNVGVSRTNPDRVFIRVVNTLFGGRFTSMLNTELRVKSGLTYGASSAFAQRKVAGPFLISTFTRNETTQQAIDKSLELLKALHDNGVTQEQLASGKNYIKGQFPPSIETSDRLAALLCELEFYGLGREEIDDLYKKIDSMTTDDARRIIRQYYPLENLVFVMIGKASEIESVARKYSTQVEKRSISQPGF